jgi:hypothetical protein
MQYCFGVYVNIKRLISMKQWQLVLQLQSPAVKPGAMSTCAFQYLHEEHAVGSSNSSSSNGSALLVLDRF